MEGVQEWFGYNLRRLRESSGWSQSELARRMKAAGWDKYNQMAVSRTEEGSRAVRLDEAVALAGVFGRGLNDLLGPVGAVDSWGAVRALTNQARSDASAARNAIYRFELARKKLEAALADFEAEPLNASEGVDTRAGEGGSAKLLRFADRVISWEPHVLVDEVLSDMEELEELGIGVDQASS